MCFAPQSAVIQAVSHQENASPVELHVLISFECSAKRSLEDLNQQRGRFPLLMLIVVVLGLSLFFVMFVQR